MAFSLWRAEVLHISLTDQSVHNKKVLNTHLDISLRVFREAARLNVDRKTDPDNYTGSHTSKVHMCASEAATELWLIQRYSTRHGVKEKSTADSYYRDF